ncbi:lytic murein transglycosylase [Oleiphilus sp. HI0118]|nr:lytic murein transglycosylase [Oleiphilus sp. HI0118]
MAEVLPVTLDNYEWAESDLAFQNITKLVGSNQWFHFPGLTPLDNQTVVRMNRDTIYSGYVADLSNGGTVTIPETDDGRYLSVMIVQNDHYIDQVFTKPGTYEIESQTDFALITARTRINPNDPKDLENVKRYQSQIEVSTPTKKEHVMPPYDMDQLLAIRAELVAEGSKLGSLKNMQGKHGQVDKQMHLYGTALGWGLLPDENAQYISYYSKEGIADSKNCSVATFEKPPINDTGFFSITVYDKEGWITNEQSILNDYNLKYNEDGTFTVHFGSCPEGSRNVLLVADNWDLLLRAYEPILDKMEAYQIPTPTLLEQ